MPRKLKLKRSGNGWTPEHRRILETGRDFLGIFDDDRDEMDFIQVYEAWTALKSTILPAWIQAHPGTRPFAWWSCDRPKGSRRECVTGRHPFDDPKNDLPRKWHWGKPGLLRACDMDLEYETEEAFLRRRNLCSAAELAILKGR